MDQKRPKRQIKGSGTKLILQRQPAALRLTIFLTMLVVMNRCCKRDAEEELPLQQIFHDVCRTFDFRGIDVAFTTIERSMYRRRSALILQ